MKNPIAAILFLEKKHKKHQEIIKDISRSHSIIEFKLKESNNLLCNEKNEIEHTIKLIDTLIVYLSSETKNNVCVCHFINLATNENIKVIGIWVENSKNDDMSVCMENFGDSVTTYPADLKNIISSEDSTWTDSNGNKVEKRKIKKHTCG